MKFSIFFFTTPKYIGFEKLEVLRNLPIFVRMFCNRRIFSKEIYLNYNWFLGFINIGYLVLICIIFLWVIFVF